MLIAQFEDLTAISQRTRAGRRQYIDYLALNSSWLIIHRSLRARWCAPKNILQSRFSYRIQRLLHPKP